MSLLSRRRVFAAKIEATAGTAETLTAADGVFNASSLEIQPAVSFDRHEAQGGFNHGLSTPGAMSGTATIVHNLQWSGSGMPTWASVLLPACGFVLSGYKFSPISRAPGAGATLPKTLTIGAYLDGKLKRLVGAMGNVVFAFPTGGVATATFTFTGKYSVDETDTPIIAPTYPVQPNLRFAAGKISWDGVNICTSTASIDAGNAVQMIECANTDRSGYAHALVTNRIPIITADPEQVLVASQDRDKQWLEMEAGPMLIELPAPGGAKIIFEATAAQLENRQGGDRNGVMIDNLTWLATHGATADSELTITFDDGE